MARVLNPHKSALPLLLTSKRLKDCTSATIRDVVLNTLQHFELPVSQLLIFMSDGASTMLAVGRSLKEHGGNFLHITCKVHALHLVAETIRNCFLEVDGLIANTKKVFLKSPKRISEFRTQCPDIPTPPEPIITRWGTWLKAVSYYSKYYQQLKTVILQFNPEDAAAIKESQSKFQDISVETDVHVIQNKYEGLCDAIQRLENSALPLKESLQIVDDVNNLLQAANDAKTSRVLKKFNSVLTKNSDFATLRQICNGVSTHPLTLFREHFNYACITSADVERSFSQYKDIFSPKRTSFHENTVETYLMLSVFHKNHSVPESHNSDNSGGSTSYTP